MRLRVLPREFIKSKPIIEILEAGGHEAYFVGGSVRDSLLEKPIHDVDIATSAYPAEVKELFPRTIDIGIEHGTVLVLMGDEEYEITTFRTESTYQDFRRPDEVVFVKSLAEDLKRRDFTINALAMDQSGEIIDLFNGQADLEQQLIRAVGEASERFNEDALRMMRALRFASQLDFEIEAKTLEAIHEHHHLLGKISVERLRIEYLKLMLGQNRQKGLIPFIETNCFAYCPGFQEQIAQLTKLSQLDNRPLLEEAQVWLLTVATLELSPASTGKFMQRWKNSKQMTNRVMTLLRGLEFRLVHEWTPSWLFALGKENVTLLEESLVFFNVTGNLTKAVAAYDALPIKSMHNLAVSGKELLPLKNQGGPWLGELLEILKENVLTGTLPNQRSDLLAFASAYVLKEEES